MKSYVVLFDPYARQEALEAAEYIAKDAPEAARKWFVGLEKAIESLRKLPRRCALARESKTLGVELHHYIYHSHRIIFRIEEEKRIVRIMHVRHAAQQTIGDDE